MTQEETLSEENEANWKKNKKTLYKRHINKSIWCDPDRPSSQDARTGLAFELSRTFYKGIILTFPEKIKCQITILNVLYRQAQTLT